MGSTIAMCANVRSLLILLWLATLPASAQTHGVTLLFLQHYVEQDTLKVNTRLRVRLSPVMREALRHGMTLHFITRFQLVEQTRLMGLIPYQRTVTTLDQPVQLSLSPFDSRWRLYNRRTGRVVTTGTLREALEVLGTFSDTRLADMTELHPGIHYALRLRLRLDSARLPLPLWLQTLFDDRWRLDSGWIVEPVDERKLWQR